MIINHSHEHKDRILPQRVFPLQGARRQTSFRSLFTGQTSYLLGLTGPHSLDSSREETQNRLGANQALSLAKSKIFLSIDCTIPVDISWFFCTSMWHWQSSITQNADSNSETNAFPMFVLTFRELLHGRKTKLVLHMQTATTQAGMRSKKQNSFTFAGCSWASDRHNTGWDELQETELVHFHWLQLSFGPTPSYVLTVSSLSPQKKRNYRALAPVSKNSNL